MHIIKSRKNIKSVKIWNLKKKIIHIVMKIFKKKGVCDYYGNY